jgi:hypothetical protein
MIARRSPHQFLKAGLLIASPEKSRDEEAIRCRAVLSLQSKLLIKYREEWAHFAYFAAAGGGISLQLRLAGVEIGIRTLVTLLNS